MEQARTTGRAAKPVEFEVLGELTELDLSLLDTEKGSKAPALKRLSERHHALARLIADGMKLGEAGMICGYDASRVSILRDDPTFKELVEFYQREKERVYYGMHETIATAGKMAWDLIIEKMDDSPDKVKMAEAIEIAKAASDRSGHGPQSSSTQLNIHVGLGAKLEEARRRVAARTIEHSSSEAAE